MPSLYPEDRTGTLVTNKVSEIQVITPINNRNFHFFVPKHAPFFEESFKIFQLINNAELPLVEGTDFYFCYKFESASLSSTKNIWGGIGFLNLSLSGEFKLEYQTLGGIWTLSDNEILEIVANEIYNPRGRTWDQVNGKPEVFGPTSHIQNADDFLTEEEVGEKLDDIAEAIANNANRPVQAPPVTLADLGIPKIGNWGMATVSQAKAGESTDTIINPVTLKAVLSHYNLLDVSKDIRDFREHIQDYNNPHETNKELLDLSKVENRGVVPEEKVIANQDDDGLVSMTLLKKYLRTHGCQTAPETEPKYAEKGSVLGYRCTSNYDRIGLFADGYGHTYEKIVESNSETCGYKAPEKNNYPPHGTVLQYYCLDYERWKIVADGYGGSYHAFVMANSADCGYQGGGSTTWPPAGTLISAMCDRTVLVQTLANGSGGSYENRIPGHPDCANNVSYPPRGTLITTFCENKNEVGKYTDGAGGYYNEVIIQNATKCGYVAPTTPPVVTTPPYGTPMGNGCEGFNYVNYFANGSGGRYSEIVEANSSRCGYSTSTTTTTSTTQTPGGNISITFTSNRSYLGPNTDEVLTSNLTGGMPNTTYFLSLWNRLEGGTTICSYMTRMVTNSAGNATFTYSHTSGGSSSAALVPDGIYNCWAELRSNECSPSPIATSGTIIRIIQGYGVNSGNRAIGFGIINPEYRIGTAPWYNAMFTGFQPNESLNWEIQMKPDGGGNYRTATVWSGTIRANSYGYCALTWSPTNQGYPSGISGPSTILPDGVYICSLKASSSVSNSNTISSYTGSYLQLNNSRFA